MNKTKQNNQAVIVLYIIRVFLRQGFLMFDLTVQSIQCERPLTILRERLAESKRVLLRLRKSTEVVSIDKNSHPPGE